MDEVRISSKGVPVSFTRVGGLLALHGNANDERETEITDRSLGDFNHRTGWWFQNSAYP
jgi:hypothetical protein